MSRRTRVDSTAGAIEIAKAANKKIEAPANVPLDKAGKLFFAGIIAELPRHEWTGHTIEMAAKLARLMSDHEGDEALLSDEGAVIEQPSGAIVTNPREGVVNRQRTAIMALRRNLSLHARVKDGDSREIAKRRSLALEIEGELDGDDLLARPSGRLS